MLAAGRHRCGRPKPVSGKSPERVLSANLPLKPRLVAGPHCTNWAGNKDRIAVTINTIFAGAHALLWTGYNSLDPEGCDGEMAG